MHALVPVLLSLLVVSSRAGPSVEGSLDHHHHHPANDDDDDDNTHEPVSPEPLLHAESLEEYYAAMEGLTGDDLRHALHEKIKGHTVFSYKQLWSILQDTDEDPEHAGNVLELYTRTSIPGVDHGGSKTEWNREHVWAKSHGFPSSTMPPYTDVHHLRPAHPYVNSVRSAKDFDDGGEPLSPDLSELCPTCATDDDSFRPAEVVRGDVARMLFYMDVRYEGDASDEPDLQVVEGVGTGTEPKIGSLCTLLKWHALDPVSDVERQRNDRIYNSWQHNRNPFIDHPEYVEEIFGSTCS